MILGESVDSFGFPIQEEKKEKISSESGAKEIDRMIIQEYSRLEEEKKMNAAKLLEEIERKLSRLGEARSKDSTPEEEEPSGVYDVVLSDESLERFADGLLTVLGELEAEKSIPPIESASMARDALLAIVRQLYQRKNSIGKMSRKFARFGAKQFLKRQRAQITKSLG
jgi:hypothetical protein